MLSFWLIRILYRVASDVFDDYPRLGVACGAGILLLCGLLAFVGGYGIFESAKTPLSTTVASAPAQATQDGQWVTLEDAEFHPDVAVRKASKRGIVYFPITDHRSTVLIIACVDELQFGSGRELKGSLTGMLSTMSDPAGILAEFTNSGFKVPKSTRSDGRICQFVPMKRHNMNGGIIFLVFAFCGGVAGAAVISVHRKRIREDEDRAAQLALSTRGTAGAATARKQPGNGAGNNRCPFCDLINFPDSHDCKRCGSSLLCNFR